jgi:NAD(P)-dependent dehydrogenase (short-subunit alcohol dehydrogenase family)
MNLNGKSVLVTGASRGIGKKIFDMMKRKGAYVFGTCTTGESNEFFQVDFTNKNSCERFYGKIRDMDFDICINNAGINIVKPFDEFTDEDYETLMSVNVKAPFKISQIVAKNMRQKGYGRIVNISSIYGVVSREHRLLYTMSKSCLIGMTKTLSLELAKHGVLVNAVSPGFTKTDLTQKVLGEKGICEVEGKVPMGRLGTTAEMANAVMFLCGDQNTYITGQNIVVDGGFLCE